MKNNLIIILKYYYKNHKNLNLPAKPIIENIINSAIIALTIT